MNLLPSSGDAISRNLCYRIPVLRRSLLLFSSATEKPTERSPDILCRRIPPFGESKVSLIPALDQWIGEGREVCKPQLQSIIRELHHHGRFKHALEVSRWMSDKRYFKLSDYDVAVRLDLISKVHGIQRAENYFNNIPKQLKLQQVYQRLLNCYAQENLVDKAENIMQVMRNLGFANTPSTYNIMLNLYRQSGMHKKLDPLMKEMEDKGIKFNSYTYGIRLTAYAASSDTQGMDRILQMVESDNSNSRLNLEWLTYAVAASAYTKAGLTDKALALLKKSESLVVTSKTKGSAYDYLLRQYAATGNKDEVVRLWEVYKKREKIYNKGYFWMIRLLLKFDDVEGAAKIFEEWNSSGLTCDFRIANFLISAYCRKGLMEKAEAVISRAKAKGGKPRTNTWYYMAAGYIDANQLDKGVEALKSAVSLSGGGLKPRRKVMAASLGHLKEKGDNREAEEFLRLLKTKGVLSPEIHDKFLNYVMNAKPKDNIPSLVEANTSVGEEEKPADNIPSLVEANTSVGDEEKPKYLTLLKRLRLWLRME